MKKLFVCLTFLICFDYIYPSCYVLGDGDSVKKDECLKRKVETTDFSVAGQTPDTCCHYETSYKVGGQKVSTSVCSAYEKSKVEDYMKTLKKEQDVYKAASKALGYSDIKYSLDCSSSYIKFGLMALFLILF